MAGMGIIWAMPEQTNRFAIQSLIAAALTVFFFCVGFAPIPMTAPFCYPASLVTSIYALAIGFRALQQIRQTGERGRGLAWVGILTGMVTILAVCCAVGLTLMLGPVIFDQITRAWPELFPR